MARSNHPCPRQRTLTRSGPQRHTWAIGMVVLLSSLSAYADETLWALDVRGIHVGYPIIVIAMAATSLLLIIARSRERTVLAELQRRRSQVDIALDSATMGLWEWDVISGDIEADEHCVRMLGYEPEEVNSHFTWWSEQTHPDDRKDAKTSLLELFNGSTPIYRAEYRMRTKSGDWIWVLDRAKVVQWTHDGKPSRAIGTHVDVSERQRTLSKLQRLATVVEQADETIIITDDQGLIEYVNPSFLTKLGYSEEEVTGQPPKLFRSGRHSKDFYTRMQDDLTHGRIWHGTLVNLCKSGASIELETTISPVNNDHGVTTHFVAVGRDVTHESLLEAQLRQAQKMEALGTLAGGIAHDFNNILSAVIGYTELAMQDSDPTGSAHTNMIEVFKAAKRAAALVAQILTFSRQTEKERSPLLLAPVMKEVLKLLRGTLPSTIDIQQNISGSCPPILSDATQMHQIIMNLCTNAYHAMREQGGVLDVRLKGIELQEEKEAGQLTLLPGHYAHISVSDTGHGMPPEIQDRIFEPYFTTKQGSNGTGLGLATVHGIVKQHDGAITVDSELGQGSTFNVFIPVCSPDLEAEEHVSAAPPMPPGNGQRILVVDDEEAIVQVVEIALGQLGYELETYTSSVMALNAFEENPDRFDCVVTDQTMPTLTGADMARRMLETRPELPIILCSGFSETVNHEKAHEIGIREYIMKPMSIRVLADAVHRVIA